MNLRVFSALLAAISVSCLNNDDIWNKIQDYKKICAKDFIADIIDDSFRGDFYGGIRLPLLPRISDKCGKLLQEICEMHIDGRPPMMTVELEHADEFKYLKPFKCEFKVRNFISSKSGKSFAYLLEELTKIPSIANRIRVVNFGFSDYVIGNELFSKFRNVEIVELHKVKKIAAGTLFPPSLKILKIYEPDCELDFAILKHTQLQELIVESRYSLFIKAKPYSLPETLKSLTLTSMHPLFSCYYSDNAIKKHVERYEQKPRHLNIRLGHIFGLKFLKTSFTFGSYPASLESIHIQTELTSTKFVQDILRHREVAKVRHYTIETHLLSDYFFKAIPSSVKSLEAKFMRSLRDETDIIGTKQLSLKWIDFDSVCGDSTEDYLSVIKRSVQLEYMKSTWNSLTGQLAVSLPPSLKTLSVHQVHGSFGQLKYCEEYERSYDFFIKLLQGEEQKLKAAKLTFSDELRNFMTSLYNVKCVREYCDNCVVFIKAYERYFKVPKQRRNSPISIQPAERETYVSDDLIRHDAELPNDIDGPVPLVYTEEEEEDDFREEMNKSPGFLKRLFSCFQKKDRQKQNQPLQESKFAMRPFGLSPEERKKREKEQLEKTRNGRGIWGILRRLFKNEKTSKRQNKTPEKLGFWELFWMRWRKNTDE